jgi:hypothetical protein
VKQITGLRSALGGGIKFGEAQSVQWIFFLLTDITFLSSGLRIKFGEA